MEKKEGPVRVGIQKKYLRLILVMIAMVAGVFVIVSAVQMNRLGKLIKETNEEQNQVVRTFSDATMDTLVSRRMGRQTELGAQTMSETFMQFSGNVGTMMEYLQLFFENPERYGEQEVLPPNPAMEGKSSVQLLCEEGVDLDSPEVKERVRKIGILSDMLLSTYDYGYADSFYIAFPDGLMLLADRDPASKYDDNGKLIPVPIHERAWYKKAVESGMFYFSDVYQDIFTGNSLITCSAPVYVDGELMAVVAGDMNLEDVQSFIEKSDGAGEYAVLLDDEGRVLFSPKKEGIFAESTGGTGQDLRENEDPELARCISDIYENLVMTNEVNQFMVDGKECYLSGSLILPINWVYLNIMQSDVVDEPAVMTKDQIDMMTDTALVVVNEGIRRFVLIVGLLLILVVILAIFFARKISGRIVNPLEKMTRRIGAIEGEDLLFEMEDAYKTGDEIEVLAESFSDMSSRTLQYVDQVKTVTAEKERIGAELNMATSIQASQIPSLFPAFPDRKEFRLYASMDPAKEVGGDFYDFYFIDDDHLALVMADVSGKGVPAALFMMVARVLIKSRLQNGESIGEALKNVNNQLCENNEASLFVTIWAAIIEISTGKGVSVNAGHEHPVLRRGDGLFELVEYDHDLAVAVMDGVTFSEREFQMNPGDCLFVYTDGAPEAQNAEHELFDMDRILKSLNLDPMAGPEELIGNVAKGIETFVDGAQQFDDITMLSFQYNGNS